MKFYLLVLFIFSFFLASWSQVDFIGSNELIQHKNIKSTLSMGIADMNGDYKDDIVLLDQGKSLVIGYQSGKNEVFRIVENGEILENAAWALSLGDLNNDGVSELFTCGISTYGNVFEQKSDGSYGFKQVLYGLTFPQNSNMADINNDGWLDIFVCDERAYNDIYLNDQSGDVLYNDFIDMYTVPPSDNSGNYGSEWVDFDDDRDIDLFITKCKPAVESPDDPLRLNVLFQNNGFNQYSEKSDEYGLKNGAQSWTGSFGDLDNDGDLDCFVSNHDTSHMIYRNIENDTFIDVTNDLMTPLRSSSIQAAIRDFDNNGFMDIYVTGDRDHMIWNQGQDVFTIQNDPFGDLEVFTFACGDLNDDGFLDVISSYGKLNLPGDYDDVLWINQGNENHFAKFSFLGESSNRQGIGTKVKVFSDLGIQVRDVKVGESYGTTNSANLHFGLGNIEVIDSIQVFWPSGQIDYYYDILADKHYLFHESNCISSFFDLQFEGDPVLCEGDTIELKVPGTFVEYHWSTGESSSSILVNSEQAISFWGIDEYACIHYSNIQKVKYEPDETPAVSFGNGASINCYGDAVQLISSPAMEYLWSTGETTEQIQVTEPGMYQVTVSGSCQDFESENIMVDFFQVPLAVPEKDTFLIKTPQPLLLSALGDSLIWYANLESNEVLASGNFETDTLDRDTSFYVTNYVTHIANTQAVGMEMHQGTPLGGSSLNSGLLFNCWKAMVIEQVNVIAASAGIRIIELKQLNEESGILELLESKEIFIESGDQVLDLGFEVLPGLNYVLTTNKESNQLHFGQNSPGLYRSNQGVSFPYHIDGLVEMTASLHGVSYYYYFYDWKVRQVSVSCFSERIPVTIILDVVSTINPSLIAFRELEIYPNPLKNFLGFTISGSKDNIDFSYEIVNVNGICLLSGVSNQNEQINVSSLEKGLHILNILSKGNEVEKSLRFIKME